MKCKFIEGRRICKIPLLINLISILIILSAIIGIILGGLLLTGGIFLINLLSFLGFLGIGVSVFGFIILIISVFRFILGFALRRGKSWARIFLIIIYLLSSLGFLIMILSKSFIFLFSFIIDLIMLLYLVFDKDVKQFFD